MHSWQIRRARPTKQRCKETDARARVTATRMWSCMGCLLRERSLFMPSSLHSCALPPRGCGMQNLSGRTYIVTGGNTGIGYETAAQLAKQNATVVMACRDAGRCAAAATRIKASVPHPVDVRCEKLDLSDLSSVREFAARVDASYPRVDALVNNAGVMFPPLSFTRDGFELTFGTNHLGHVLLTDLLLDKLKASAPSRIINLSSRAHEFGQLDLKDLDFAKRGYGQGIVAYGTSKLANILHAQELARHLNGSGVTAVSVHPGTVRTGALMRGHVQSRKCTASHNVCVCASQSEQLRMRSPTFTSPCVHAPARCAELYRYLPFGQEMLE
ncbi:SDR family NAD(P)-dependent oxidoreductase, partial [archaeon]